MEIPNRETGDRWRQRMKQVLGLGAAGVALGGVAGSYYFTHHEIQTEIAATEVGITPKFNGEINIKNGVIPDVRAPSGRFIGADITLGNSTIPGDGMTSEITSRLIATYGGVATNPEGEREQITGVIKQQAVEAGVVAGIAGLIPTVGYLTLGRVRRKELLEKSRGYAIPALGAVAALTAGAGTVHATAADRAEPKWVPLGEVVKAANRIPELQEFEVRDNAMSGITRELITGILTTYQKSKTFYKELEETVRLSSAEFRQPEAGEIVALVVSDRHNNIAMDTVLRATADVAGASLVINLGDDTSSGKSWEAFSLRSFTTNFSDITTIALGGNHDKGDFVIDYLSESGAITPNGELQEVEGITIAMANDPRKSDYTPEQREAEVSYSDATEALADLACSEAEGVNLVLAHSASMGAEALERGCADLVIGGHLHSYRSPESVVGSNGRRGYTMTNGTSGGAVFSFALGTSLKREANALLVTFSADKTPVGVQNVRYLPSGLAMADEYIHLFATQTEEETSFLPGVEAKQKDKSSR